MRKLTEKSSSDMPKSNPPTFFALISDVHANIDAVEAFFEDIKQWQVRGIFCLGDIVGYGP
jgi:predicted phosphodiesterase